MNRVGLIACAVAMFLAAAMAPKVTRKMADFEVYWKSAQRARAAEPLYRIEDGHYQFKYLPAFAVLAIPLGFLPLGVAKGVWFALSVMLLAGTIAMSIALQPELRKPRWLIVAIIVVALGKFYAHELVLGQVNLLFGVLVLAALAAIRTGREVIAGALVAFAIAVKPYAVLFVPWLVARRRAPSILAVMLGLVIIMAVAALAYGLAGAVAEHQAWWRTVAGSTAPNLTNPDNVSVAAMYTKWFGASPLVTALTLFTTVALLVIAFVTFRRRDNQKFPEGLEGALLLTLVPLLSPQGWDYVFLVSTLAIAYLANYEDRLPIGVRILTIAAIPTIGLSLYDVMGRATYALFMSFSIITVCYFVVIAALWTLRLRRVA